MTAAEWTGIRGFVRSMLSESDGSISATRCVIAVIVSFAVGWITALVVRVQGPVTLTDLSEFVGKTGMYVASICSALYGVNRIADAFGKRPDGQ